MKTRFTYFAVLFFFLLLPITTSAQELLNRVPQSESDYKAMEKNVLASIDWMENTPMDQEPEKHKQQYEYLIAWISGSPDITIDLKANIVKFSEKNPELLIVFMGGWVRYALQNNYSNDTFQGNLAGLKSVVKVYKTGVFKQDKETAKLVQMERNGLLEDWLKERLAEK